MLQSPDDTIIAISTPSGSSLRAILRISGPDAFCCLNNIFTQELPANYPLTKQNTSAGDSKSHVDAIRRTPTFRSINGYIAIKEEHVYIPVTLYIMKSPHSFTREDIVEIHTVGSVPIIEMILSEILANHKRFVSDEIKEDYSDDKQLTDRPGNASFKNDANPVIRLAEPGEFTKRAFLNGRIDLAQAEAVIKLIRSHTESEILAGISLLKGEIRILIDKVRDQVIALCGLVEASIDFSDQDITLIPHEDIENRLHMIHNELLNLTSTEKSERDVHPEGINTVLCGRPNVGKSSLLNAFGPEIETIVSDSPHTTRDTIKRTIRLHNICFNFFDNPGIHIPTENTGNEKHLEEKENINLKAIAKSQEALYYADVVIFVLDGSNELRDMDKILFDKINCQKKIIVINKCDLAQKINLNELGNNIYKSSVIKTSAANGKGIDDLKKELTNLVLKGHIDKSGSHAIMNARQTLALKNTANFINYALETTKNRESLEFIALDLRNALNALGEIVGHVLTDDILDKIFSEFCIGK